MFSAEYLQLPLNMSSSLKMVTGSGLPIRPDLESPLTVDPLRRSCVDCGLATGNFCDGGKSCEFNKVATPLCTYCETLHDFCRFCRREQSCTPPLRQTHWSGQPHRLSRDYARLVPGIDRARRLAWAIAEEAANPRVDNPRVGVDNDENAVDFAQRRTKCPTLFFGGGMTGDVAVCDKTPHRPLEQRYRDTFESMDEKPYHFNACGGDKVFAARGQTSVKCKELKEKLVERWTAITAVDFRSTSTTSTELS